jgi:hypothetical protein
VFFPLHVLRILVLNQIKDHEKKLGKISAVC